MNKLSSPTGQTSGPRRIAGEDCATYVGERPTERRISGGICERRGRRSRACGEYLCFWDDDNCYFPHALATLYAAAYGVDVGVVHVLHDEQGQRRLMPAKWEGASPSKARSDTMCFCVRTSPRPNLQMVR